MSFSTHSPPSAFYGPFPERGSAVPLKFLLLFAYVSPFPISGPWFSLLFVIGISVYSLLSLHFTHIVHDLISDHLLMRLYFKFQLIFHFFLHTILHSFLFFRVFHKVGPILQSLLVGLGFQGVHIFIMIFHYSHGLSIRSYDFTVHSSPKQL